MRKFLGPAVLLVLTLAVTGCSTFNKLTGQTDETVLPGSREDAIPGRAQFPDPSDRAPTVPQPGDQGTAQQQPAQTAPPEVHCQPGDKACQPGSDGTFNDPQ
jgi:hypothetical protein